VPGAISALRSNSFMGVSRYKPGRVRLPNRLRRDDIAQSRARITPP
jgi:hypothetical protein